MINQSSTWFAANNPLLKQNDLGIETDTGNIKVGDGLTSWNELGYFRINDGYTEATGTNTYVGSFEFPNLTVITEGMAFKVKFLNANTGAATININELGAIPIKKNVTAALGIGDILANQILLIIFDGNNFQVI